MLPNEDGESIRVERCNVFASLCCLEDSTAEQQVFGICVSFSDGKQVRYSDISVQCEEVEVLAKRLTGSSIAYDILPDVVDDYLGEIYGLRF